MDGAELLGKIVVASLMDNGKMEYNMDTLDILDNLVAAINQNGKMII